MRITDDHKDARLNVTQTATMAGLHVAHFRRLVRRRIFPPPKRTVKGKPYFDYGLLQQIAAVIRRKIGHNGQEVMFYSSQKKKPSKGTTPRPGRSGRTGDPYLASLVEGLRQLGLTDAQLDVTKIREVMSELFGSERPGLSQAIPDVARRLLVEE